MPFATAVLVGTCVLAPLTLATLAVLIVLVRRGTAWREDKSSYNHLTRVATSYFTSVIYGYLLISGLVLLFLSSQTKV